MNFIENTGLLVKPFDRLSKLEREQISDYVNMYAYKFKAQVAKRLISPRKGRIDLAAALNLSAKVAVSHLSCNTSTLKSAPASWSSF